jgi:Zn-dependent membrane protease YugP
MEWFLELAQTWGGYVLLVVLQSVLSLGISGGYRVTRAWLDRRHADDLPVHAGQWLRETLVARGLESKVRLWVVPQNADTVDAFLPRADAIVLGQRTFFKSDPSFWAIAAHELGHVLVRLRAPWVHRVFLLARVGARSAAQIGAMFLLTNILYGSHTLTVWALRGYACALALGGVVLIDEALASVLAMRALAADGRLGKRQMGGAALGLVAAFMTYVGASVGQIITLVQSDYIARVVEGSRHFELGDPLAGAAMIAAWGLAALLGLRAIALLARAVRPPLLTAAQQKTKLAADLFYELCVAGLLFLLWDQEAGELFLVSMAVAFIAVRRVVGLAILIPTLPIGIAIVAVVALVFLYFRRTGAAVSKLAEGEESDVFKTTVAEHEKRELARTQAESSIVNSTLAKRIAFEVRLEYAANAAFVPVLIAYALGGAS